MVYGLYILMVYTYVYTCQYILINMREEVYPH